MLENRLGSGGDGVREESTYVVSDMVRFVLKSWGLTRVSTFDWMFMQRKNEKENPEKLC